MKALRWYAKKDLRYVDIPEPFPGPGQIKIQVLFASICGTDLKEYAHGPIMIPKNKAPLTLGHEFVGKVVEIGKGVKDFKVGDRVSGVGNYYCGECYFCKKSLYNLCEKQEFAGLNVDGCMAEYFVHPAYSCYKLPDTVTDEAGTLVEPLAVAFHAIHQARVQAGDTIAIVGDGTIGLSVLLAAKAAGASEVFLVSKHKGRGQLALQIGAKAVIYLDEENPIEKIKHLTGGIGTDAAFECVGNSETTQLAVELTRRGGIAVIIGVFEKPGAFDFSSITFNERIMVGSSIYVHEGKTVINLIADKRINPAPLISAIVPLQYAVEKGFEELLQNKEKSIKILLRVT